jgi:rhamnosyltransferase
MAALSIPDSSCASRAQPVAASGSSKPRILILLAAYNGAAWICEQVESILSQEDVEVSLAIRDDGSSDGTLEKLTRFRCDPRLQILPTADPTGSAARNFLKLIVEQPANGYDFVALSDQDDIWYPDKLARACLALGKEQAAGYSSATVARWHNGSEQLIRLSGRPRTTDFLFEGAGQGCTFVLSSTFYERARHFIATQPHLTEDLHFHDWGIYALARAWKLPWLFDPRPSLIYRQHDRNDIGSRGSLRGARKRLALLRSGWYRAELERICVLCSAAAKEDPTISTWRSLLLQQAGWRRTVRLAWFCFRGGRRKGLDNAILTVACLAGWI